MRAVVLAGKEQIEVRELPKPTTKPGWVLVRVKAGGICGSDLHFYHEPQPDNGPRLGMAIGHEAAGIVEAVGAAVSAVKPGDRVSVYHWIGCGHCPACRSGDRHLCPERIGIAASGNGTSAEYLLAPEANCLPLPESLSFETGALIACCAGTAFSALAKLQVSARDDLLIFGLGPVGLSTLVEAHALGARTLCVELVSERIDLARRLGADVVIDAKVDDPVSVIHDLTGGRGVRKAIEASGASSARAQLVQALATGGTGIYIGLGKPSPVIDPAQLIDSEKTLRGSHVMPMRLYQPLVEFLASRQVNLDAIITHRFPLEAGPEAFALFDTRTTGKILFTME